MNALNRTRMANRYPGKWVALKPDRKSVIAAAGSVKGVRKAALHKGYKNAIITRMPKTIRSFVGFHTAA